MLKVAFVYGEQSTHKRTYFHFGRISCILGGLLTVPQLGVGDAPSS